ncbi:MAG TPA: aldose 1-epimerase [Gaiellales bacterium]|nr:aldose 1-epimerase [Gaiellales bacterium]
MTAVHRIAAGALAATFVPSLAMVCSSLTDGGEELLDQRHGLDAYAQRGSTMGIPLLHPWANRLDAPLPASPLLHRDANGLAIHGVLPAALPFEVVASGAGWLRGEFCSDRSAGLMELFGHPHRLTLEASLDAGGLTIRTELEATGAGPVPVAYGFHPYLHPPAGDRDSWSVEGPFRSAIELDDRMLPTGRRMPAPPLADRLAGRTHDDAFADVRDGDRFTVSDGVRRLTVTMIEGYGFVQLYAPADAPVVCFEPMTAPTNALATGEGLGRVEPGGSAVAAFSVGVSRA